MEICFTLSERIFSQRYLNKLQCKNVTFPNFHLFHRYLSVYNSLFLVYPHPNVSPLLCRNTDILFSCDLTLKSDKCREQYCKYRMNLGRFWRIG